MCSFVVNTLPYYLSVWLTSLPVTPALSACISFLRAAPCPTVNDYCRKRSRVSWMADEIDGSGSCRESRTAPLFGRLIAFWEERGKDVGDSNFPFVLSRTNLACLLFLRSNVVSNHPNDRSYNRHQRIITTRLQLAGDTDRRTAGKHW